MDPYFTQNMSSALDSNSSTIQSLTQELASGVSVSSASDNPSAAATSQLLRGQDLTDAQFVSSASSHEALLQVSDSALGDVVAQITQAVSLATQGVNGTLTAANRSAVATQLASIREEVVSLANTSYQGNYIFSGSATDTQPYTLNTATSPATFTYNGNYETVYTDTPGGATIATGFPGTAFFGGQHGVLSALNQMIADLSATTLPSTATADAQALSTALGSLTDARATLDTSINQLQSASGYASTQQTQLTAEQSSLVSADYAEVSTDLKTAETQQTALYSVIATIGQNSLFSYLKG